MLADSNSELVSHCCSPLGETRQSRTYIHIWTVTESILYKEIHNPAALNNSNKTSTGLYRWLGETNSKLLQIVTSNPFNANTDLGSQPHQRLEITSRSLSFTQFIIQILMKSCPLTGLRQTMIVSVWLSINVDSWLIIIMEVWSLVKALYLPDTQSLLTLSGKDSGEPPYQTFLYNDEF